MLSLDGKSKGGIPIRVLGYQKGSGEIPLPLGSGWCALELALPLGSGERGGESREGPLPTRSEPVCNGIEAAPWQRAVGSMRLGRGFSVAKEQCDSKGVPTPQQWAVVFELGCLAAASGGAVRQGCCPSAASGKVEVEICPLPLGSGRCALVLALPPGSAWWAMRLELECVGVWPFRFVCRECWLSCGIILL